MKNKNIYLGMVFLVGIILFVHSISAFAVSSQYWEENPVIVYPGQSTEIYVVLQNMAGTEDLTVKGVIIEGSEIAALSEPTATYSVPVGTRKNVYIQINVPEDTTIPSNYSLIMSFVTSVEGGTLGLGSGVQKTIPLLIVKEPREPFEFKCSPWCYIILVGVVILVVVIILVLKKKKKKRK